jgi:signal transduction histidine kinase
MRGRFARRFGCFILVVLLVLVASAALLIWLVASLLGLLVPGRAEIVGGAGVTLAILLALVAAALIGGGLRRLAGPIGDLVEAAGRVEAGDYGARVSERGPRELRSLARAFNEMSARLEATEEQRRRLLADVTHELRTPLTVVEGDLEALLDGVHPRDDAHLAGILDETRIFGRLVDDLRTLALAEAGSLTIRREATDIEVLVSETLGSFRSQAEAAGVELRAVVAPDLPAVDLDPLRTREVLANLLGNALRYTDRGGSISVSVAPVEARREVEVSVADTGSGIAADVLPHVFERFYRSPDSPGSGLGLAIARSLVVAQGGRISATSEPGSGTAVSFRLSVSSEAS